MNNVLNFTTPGRSLYAWLDDNHQVVPVPAEFVAEKQALSIQLATSYAVDPTGARVTISTVFTALPGPDDSHFETMLFGGHYDNSRWRYHTYRQAMERHNEITDLISASAPQPALPNPETRPCTSSSTARTVPTSSSSSATPS